MTQVSVTDRILARLRTRAAREAQPTAVSPPGDSSAIRSIEPPPIRHTLLALSPRDVIRFTFEGNREHVAGAVIAASDDSLLLDRGGLSTLYRLNEVAGLQRYYGRTSRAGAALFGGAGAGVGSMAGQAFPRDD
jgi:hypothetical protein